MIKAGSKVKIKENAFGDSQEPNDAKARGQIAVIVTDLEEQFGVEWAGCWEAQLDDGDVVQVITEELEES